MPRLIVPTNTTTLVMMMILVTTATFLTNAFAFTTIPSSKPFTSRSSSSSSTTTTRTRTKTSISAKSRSQSPLLDEGLEAYSYKFEGRRAMVTKEKAIVAFNELARLYGDEEAVAMVKLESRVLVFNSDNYAPCLASWTEQFGLEAAQGMVGRNPNLLAIRPELAVKPAEDCMVFSYIIAASRPLPKILGAGLLLSIATAGMH
ncbi:hypothetical protein FRACYDRAFT_274757 [Fragilariopsis cylindrus CCMP1102]|uniref:Uncharacterized protein n=1 Tax=Fragilariopsis cylindrus CCMP1102 TaxID=635003 RepID=A0A1E7FJN0_9STRA|nr:hypothetical protein FRACYDRAFT_274757 [Fragilariopsis cylindrus CCMP1102]|eukprot:OEU18366.1 hypothetical protein FRACYDRAFT_274757 [Fragilariopsis cylindrus CCMP1102]